VRCAGCQNELEVGDQYIEATASEYLGTEDTGLDGLMGEIFGSGAGAKIVYCEDCTEDGGRFRLSTFYGDETAALGQEQPS
jgi:hypothetical protein